MILTDIYQQKAKTQNLTFVSVKKYAAIFMLFCISYQYMIKLGIMAWYQLNKEYVATVLCENKNKPELKCCGKCYLNKQLKKAEGPANDSKQLPGKNHITELSEFIPVIALNFNYSLFQTTGNILHDRYKQTQGYHPATSIFHPPPFIT